MPRCASCDALAVFLSHPIHAFLPLQAGADEEEFDEGAMDEQTAHMTAEEKEVFLANFRASALSDDEEEDYEEEPEDEEDEDEEGSGAEEEGDDNGEGERRDSVVKGLCDHFEGRGLSSPSVGDKHE